MRVICIDGTPQKCNYSLPEGVPLEVVQSPLWEDCFLVLLYKYDPVNGLRTHWAKRRFIPLSEIDETQLQSHTVKEVQL